MYPECVHTRNSIPSFQPYIQQYAAYCQHHKVITALSVLEYAIARVCHVQFGPTSLEAYPGL